MIIMQTLLRSLLLTVLISFITPVVLLTGLFATLCGIGYLPVVDTIAQIGVTDLLKFLAIFGSGSPLQGIVVIGVTFSLVGALFDTYAFYSYQHHS